VGYSAVSDLAASKVNVAELVHRAEDRGIYARSALKAALWARGKPLGLYSMADVLGLKNF